MGQNLQKHLKSSTSFIVMIRTQIQQTVAERPQSQLHAAVTAATSPTNNIHNNSDDS